MNNLRIIYAGLAATAVMTAFMLLGTAIGLPNMNVGRMLGKPLGDSEIAGWVAHFVIGILMVIPYAYLLNKWIPVENRYARGLIYGILIFVFSQMAYTVINIAGYLEWNEKESMGLMVFGNAIACMIYGAVLGAFYLRLGPDELSDSKNPPIHKNTAQSY